MMLLLNGHVVAGSYLPALIMMTVVAVSPDPLDVQLKRAQKYFGNQANPASP